MSRLDRTERLGITLGAAAILFGSVCTWMAGLLNDDRWLIGSGSSLVLVIGIVLVCWPVADDEPDAGIELVRQATERQTWNDFVDAHPFVDALHRKPLSELDLKPKPRYKRVPINHELAAQDAEWKRIQDGAGD